MRIISIIFLMFFAVPSFSQQKEQGKGAEITTQKQGLSVEEMLKYRYYYLEYARREEAREYAEAYELLRHCLQVNPQAAEAHFSISAYETILGHDSVAISHLETAVSLEPWNDDFLEGLAEQYFYIATKENNKRDEKYLKLSAEVYETLSTTYPDRTEYLQALVQIYGNTRDYARMLDVLNRIEIQEGQSEDLTLTKMQVYSAMGDEQGAYDELQRLMKNNPNDLNYRVMTGNWLLSVGRKDEAYKEYVAVLQEEPENALAQMSLMDYYRSIGKTDDADSLMYAILENPRTEADTRITLMRQVVQDSELTGGDSLRVLQIFNRVLSLPQRTSEMAEMKVAYLAEKKMSEDSIKVALRQVLEIAPENTQARLTLIDMLWRDSVSEEVIKECEEAIAYNPEEAALYYYLGLAHYFMEDNNAALEAFRRGTEHFDEETPIVIKSNTYMLMGDLLHGMNRPKEAYEAYDSCLVFSPDKVECLNNYAYYLSEEGIDLKKAEQMSLKTIKAEPENYTYLDTYAWILYKQQRYEEARIYIDQAVRADMDSISAVFYDHAGDIYIKLGLRDEATEFWQKALDDDIENAAEIRKKITKARKKK